MQVWTIVVAGGSGSRFGGAKQFVNIRGTSILDRSVATARRCSSGGVVVVLPAGAQWDAPSGVAVVAGGATRAQSVRNGLAVIDESAEIVVVHDAARPLASANLFGAVIAAVADGADAAVPALVITDTIKRVDGKRVVETVDREGLVAVQTPQAFAAGALRRAHARGGDGTDDASLIEAFGGTVVVVTGEHRNLKITVPEDVEFAAALLDSP